VGVERGPSVVALVEAAVRGDPIARERVLGAGVEGRTALLRRAQAGLARSAEALRMLRAAGGVRSADEAAAIGDLVADPALRAEALDLLVADVGAAGSERLGALLVESPGTAPEVAAALARLGGQGRRESAIRALLVGAAAGRPEAAAEAVRLGGAPVLDRLLDALPEACLGEPSLAAAVRDGPSTVASRLLRLAEAGDERALALAVATGADDVAPLLVARSLGEDRPVAERAVVSLGRLRGATRWLGLARALDGPAAESAARALAAAPREALRALRDLALDSGADRAVAMAGLAAIGPDGLAIVERMASRPAYVPVALRALEGSPRPEASVVLAGLASRTGLLRPAADALGRRLGAGHAEAGELLLALGARGEEQAAVAALLLGGAPGEERLREAARTPGMARFALPALERASQRSRDAVEAAAAPRVPRRSPGI
jgi:hypothetical protein